MDDKKGFIKLMVIILFMGSFFWLVHFYMITSSSDHDEIHTVWAIQRGINSIALYLMSAILFISIIIGYGICSLMTQKEKESAQKTNAEN